LGTIPIGLLSIFIFFKVQPNIIKEFLLILDLGNINKNYYQNIIKSRLALSPFSLKKSKDSLPLYFNSMF
jgi:hypothetical protein